MEKCTDVVARTEQAFNALGYTTATEVEKYIKGLAEGTQKSPAGFTLLQMFRVAARWCLPCRDGDGWAIPPEELNEIEAQIQVRDALDKK